MKSKKDYSIANFPIGLFMQIMQTGNVSLIDAPARKQADVWAKIYDEYIEAYGISESYQSYLDLKGTAIDLYFKAFCQGQKHFATLAEVKERQAEAVLMETTGQSFDVMLASVSKFMGFRVDPATTSVKEFFSYVELMQKTIKANGKKD